MSQTTPPKRRLGEILVDAGVLDEAQLKSALQGQKRWGGRLGKTLVEMGYVTDEAFVWALAQQLKIPAVDLDKVQLSPQDVKSWLKVDVAERYNVFPLGFDGKQKAMRLATSDPTNVDALKELTFSMGLPIATAVAGSNAIDRAIRRHYYGETPETPRSPGTQGSGFILLPTAHEGEPAPFAAGNDPLLDLAEDASEVAMLRARVEHLESTVTTQKQVLRSILELLLAKGVLTRDEYLARMKAGTVR